jgi:hypothetical protein
MPFTPLALVDLMLLSVIEFAWSFLVVVVPESLKLVLVSFNQLLKVTL